jgi:hypothetical protein
MQWPFLAALASVADPSDVVVVTVVVVVVVVVPALATRPSPTRATEASTSDCRRFMVFLRI